MTFASPRQLRTPICVYNAYILVCTHIHISRRVRIRFLTAHAAVLVFFSFSRHFSWAPVTARIIAALFTLISFFSIFPFARERGRILGEAYEKTYLPLNW